MLAAEPTPDGLKEELPEFLNVLLTPAVAGLTCRLDRPVACDLSPAVVHFDDVARRLNGQTQVWLPKVIMEHPSKLERDITGTNYDDFKARFPRIRFKVLHKVNSQLSNRKLYEKGYLKNYVEDYLQSPLVKKIAAVPLPN